MLVTYMPTAVSRGAVQGGHNLAHVSVKCNGGVLLTERAGPLQLSDFGIAQTLPGDEDYITTEAHGTVTHMPPELLMDCKLSTACDVYSFGNPPPPPPLSPAQGFLPGLRGQRYGILMNGTPSLPRVCCRHDTVGAVSLPAAI